MNRPGLVQPVDGRPGVSAGVGVTLVVAGAIFGLLSPQGWPPSWMRTWRAYRDAGRVFALLLSLLVWGPLSRRRSRSGGHA